MRALYSEAVSGMGAGSPDKKMMVIYLHTMLSNYTQIFSEPCSAIPNFDWNYTSQIDLVTSRDQFGAKSIGEM